MSNSPCPPENAAPAALVSPERATGTCSSSSSSSPPAPPPPPPPPPAIPPAPPLPPALSSAPHPGPDSINTDAPPPPPAPGPAPGPPATQEEATSSTVPPPPATPAAQHGTTHADQIKYARGPAVLQRPQGPSLLTQALATARGIPRHSSSSHIDSSTAASQSAVDSSHHPPSNRDVKPRDPRHGPSHHGEGDVLAQRVSPRKPTMPSLTSVATTVAPPAFGRLDIDLGEVNSMLNGHREFLAKTKDREGDFKNRLGNRANTFAADTPSGHALFTDSPTAMYDGHADENTAIEERPVLRTWKTEHRVSLGPEKAWSIGTGEIDSDGDSGQVEKSITQALAGHEPNARSRKASHSLRFFKEGLPEEKVKRKETRPSTHREKTGDIAHEGEGLLKEGDVNKTKTRDLDDKTPTAKGPPRAKTTPAGLRTPDAVDTIEEAPEDYFISKHMETSLHASPMKPAKSPCKLAAHDQQHVEPTEPCSGGLELRRESDASTGGGDSAVDEGDESGEEKISSAVFVPHQAPPEQPTEHAPVPGAPPRSVPARTQSRHDDFHPWLVKADEPEFDEHGEPIDRKLKSEPTQSSSVAPELDITQPAGPAAAIESRDVSAKPSRPVSQYHEEAVHDHQLEPTQPLEAIELIPYKHQVGGHTTLWRFSKRAVCKQLNNRENEFYEKIEHYHRDLLAFLPRYIGVLNVTFQKQSRRKSTMKRDDHAVDRHHPDDDSKANGTSRTSHEADPPTDRPRMISQSLQNNQGQIPTVTFVDNQHILPRSLLQPSLPSPPSLGGRFRSSSASTLPHSETAPQDVPVTPTKTALTRPSLSDRHANSWGATTVNKRLRNEVFNDAFLKQPIAIHRHRKGHQRPMPRRTLQQSLRPTGSDPSLAESHEKRAQAAREAAERTLSASSLAQTQSDLGYIDTFCDAEGEEDEGAPKDVTGTSAPEPEIFGGSSPAALKKKRRYSGTGLRRKPDDVRDDRGNLKYFEEADEVVYKGSRDEIVPHPKTPVKANAPTPPAEQPVEATINGGGEVQHPNAFVSAITSAATSALPSPTSEFKKIPRPINPKEAQTQSDSRVEYFLLLEDLTAGMKRPCIMDLKMGTRQYGVDANPKKQQSQKGKCAKTTSRELGVRVCGLQVWDVQTQSYVFRDKYYGRTLKKGGEFQGALTRFLYDGVDPASILRHIPTVLRKLDELEVIVGRLKGYRFYAASLLMFYDGDTSADASNGYETAAIDDSTTDFATDTEEAPRRQKKSKRDIDFKIADFANCITPYDPMEDKACPPRHPGEPDRGFMRGLHSLRMYFLKIQRDTRAQMGLVSSGNGEAMGYPEDYDDEGSVSE
ncbi:inositol polyphosphate kinase kcs1 [Podospora bellae-mahoneyi]|uniref:Kinase n=1 Tax=Podospora bellae-mahoneyi TaxID=2093777 RepID=A0ABR0FA63_9PEZI|nr:inositol polyphosphate kinase kcs1 [Podospora bellae-mahoneyi]